MEERIERKLRAFAKVISILVPWHLLGVSIKG
jgi:hypothetical protein